ncbi:MAG TPA: hypothetical protein DEQ64_01640 [Lachnoclostridium sp.]|nr:hypothetical protein [Lachnoclostridium sp.]
MNNKHILLFLQMTPPQEQVSHHPNTLRRDMLVFCSQENDKSCGRPYPVFPLDWGPQILIIVGFHLRIRQKFHRNKAFLDLSE